jgi:AcrR family transcriptional regulator
MNGRLRKAGTPRARRRDRQRDTILRAAARLFREQGFADTGMRDIAAAADISAANLYHYFDGKHELLFYCQDRALDRMLDAVASARRATPSAADRLRLVFTAHMQPIFRSSRSPRRSGRRSSASATSTSMRCAG